MENNVYNRVFVPLDGSHTSELALQEALKLAVAVGAKVRFAHIFETFQRSSSEGMIDMTDMLRAEGQDVLAKAEARAQAAGVDCDKTLADGRGRRIAAAIVEEAAHWPAELIVMGTHGRRGVEHLVLGSVAEGVARRADVPVLLVRGR